MPLVCWRQRAANRAMACMDQKKSGPQQKEGLHRVQRDRDVLASLVLYSGRREAGERPYAIGRDYSLSGDEELVLGNQLARCISAPRGEGVTAVAIEECGDRARSLRICVAAHGNRGDIPMKNLRSFLKPASEYASSLVRRSPMERNDVLKRLIKEVVRFNRDRILFRIGSDLVKKPSASMFPPLSLLEQDLDQASMATSRLKAFLQALGRVVSMGVDIMTMANLHALESLVLSAYELCYPDGVRSSLPTQLRSAGVGQSLLHGHKAIVPQVEKIGQYVETCKYLLRLVDLHPRLFSRDVEVFACWNPKASAPNVHAEMLLVAHYETNPPKRPPRAIGCNKLACGYCNVVIQCQGKYRISGTHGWPYPCGELPVTDSTGAVVPALLALLRKVNRKFEKQKRRAKKMSYRQHPIESRPSSQIG
jgi:hypothetical protein